MRGSDLTHLRELGRYQWCPQCGKAMDAQSLAAGSLNCATCRHKNRTTEEGAGLSRFCVYCGAEKSSYELSRQSGSLGDILCIPHSNLVISAFERERQVFREVWSNELRVLVASPPTPEITKRMEELHATITRAGEQDRSFSPLVVTPNGAGQKEE